MENTALVCGLLCKFKFDHVHLPANAEIVQVVPFLYRRKAMSLGVDLGDIGLQPRFSGKILVYIRKPASESLPAI